MKRSINPKYSKMNIPYNVITSCRFQVIQRHMKKVGEELKKFLERCQKNPHGTEAAREKHEAMTERLQNDIKTQLLNR